MEIGGRNLQFFIFILLKCQVMTISLSKALEKKKKKKSYIPAINLFPEPNQPRPEGNLQQIISLQTRKFTSHQIA